MILRINLLHLNSTQVQFIVLKPYFIFYIKLLKTNIRSINEHLHVGLQSITTDPLSSNVMMGFLFSKLYTFRCNSLLKVCL